MMGLVRDQWAQHSMGNCESHNLKRKLVNNVASTSWQREKLTLITNGENQEYSKICTASPFLLARYIAAAMGIHFIVMIMIYSALIVNSLYNQEAQVSSNESYCSPCPKNWMHYRNNCYQFFDESKNWFQSQASCMSQNSSLLMIYSKEDQDFLKLVKSYHWMGLIRNSTNGIWQWEDGSSHSSSQLTLVKMENGNCAVYGSNFKGYTENCLTPYTYICMQRIV